MKKKAAPYWSSGAQCTQGGGLLRKICAPRGSQMAKLWQPPCCCSRAKDTRRPPAPYVSLIVSSQELLHSPLGISGISSLRKPFWAAQRDKQCSSLHCIWDDFLWVCLFDRVWVSFQLLMDWLDQGKEEYFTRAPWTDLLLCSHTCPAALGMATITLSLLNSLNQPLAACPIPQLILSAEVR